MALFVRLTASTLILSCTAKSLSSDFSSKSFFAVNFGVFPMHQSHDAKLLRISIRPGNHFSVGLINWKPRCFIINSRPPSCSSVADVRKNSYLFRMRIHSIIESINSCIVFFFFCEEKKGRNKSHTQPLITIVAYSHADLHQQDSLLGSELRLSLC